MPGKVNLGAMNVSVQIVRRDLLTPLPGSAAPVHAYTAILTTRAKVESKGGAKEFAKIEINGKEVTHTFTIRFTTIPFDVRHRLRDVRGQLYQILSVDNVDLQNVLMKINCALIGNDDVEAAA